MSKHNATLRMRLADEVNVVDFLRALNAAGMTISNEGGLIVIHWIKAIRLGPEPDPKVVAGPWPPLETKRTP